MPNTPADHDAVQESVTRADHHSSGVDHAAHEAKPTKSLRKFLLRSILVLVLLAALLIALAPTLLSTGPGTRWLVSVINNQIPGELSVDDLSLSWFGGQNILGVDYTDKDQGLQAQVTSINAGDMGLFDLLTGSRRFGDVLVDGIDLTYTQRSGDLSDKPSWHEEPRSGKQPFALPPSLSGSLVVTNLSVTYLPVEREAIRLTMARDEIRVADLRDITFHFDVIFRQGLKKGRVSLKGGALNLFDPEGFIQTGEAAYDVTLMVAHLPIAAIDQLSSGISEKIKPGQIIALLGEGDDLMANCSLNGTIEDFSSSLSVLTPKLRVELKQRAEGQTLIASPDSFAKYDMDQEAFAALFPQSGLKLVEPTRIELASVEVALPIVDKAVDWDKATASLLVKAGANLALVDERGETLGIDALKVTGTSESIADQLSFKLTTILSAVDRAGQVTREPVAVDLIIREPLKPTREIDFFSKELPVRLADALVGQEGKLVLWLGKTLALQADVQGKVVTDAQGNTRIEQQFSLRPEGQVTGTVSGSYRQGLFTLATPSNEPIEAVLSPDAFASLMEMLSGRQGEPALTIAQAMPVYLTLSEKERGSVSIATRSGKKGIKRFYPDPDQTYLGATVELSPARVFDPKLKKTYELRGGSLFFSAPDLRGEVHVQAELDLWVRPDAGEQGVASLLTWQTTLTDLLDSEGSVPLDGKALMQQVSATGGMTLRNTPSGLMDSLLNREGDLASILGPIVQQMDAGFTYKDGQPTGATVRLNWDEANNQPIPGAWASMKPAAFDIDANQMLTVRGGQDLELEVRVSEDFGDRWMGKLHPILFDAKSGDRPVKINVNGKSFRFPMQGDKMQGSRVEASVDLGTIQFGDDALLGKLLNWTNRPGERAVFEPAKVALIDGKISYDQFDLTVGKVKLRLDGEVDIATGQIVDMAVRVPGDSLIRVFNELDGVIKPDDFLSIPMTGEIRKPTFDSKLIGKEVARLVTRGLIDQQKDKLGDLIRKGIGGDDKPKPAEKDDPPKGEANEPGEDPADQPAEEPAKDVTDELIDRGLDLLFKRLGRDQDKPKQD